MILKMNLILYLIWLIKMINSVINNVVDKVNKKEEIAPFLFLWSPISDLNLKIQDLSKNLSEILDINKNFIFTFKETEWKIKVKDIKEFLEKTFVTPSFWSQIFIIENISKMTEESANSCLKIFEEPWIWNTLFLTSESESNILDTILSRCTIVNTNQQEKFEKNEFYYNMIDDYVRGINFLFASYIFKEKLEKEDYINILKNLILYNKDNLIFLDMIWEINSDITWIQKNNILPKYIVDKYLLKIKLHK